jgi:hypothetical protein
LFDTCNRSEARRRRARRVALPQRLEALATEFASIRVHTFPRSSAESPERLHIDFAKKAYHAGNRRDYTEQMALWLQRQEAMALAGVYIEYEYYIMLPQATSLTSTTACYVTNRPTTTSGVFLMAVRFGSGPLDSLGAFLLLFSRSRDFTSSSATMDSQLPSDQVKFTDCSPMDSTRLSGARRLAAAVLAAVL